jgi:xanthine dehydrogenase accessory factor
MKKDLAEAILAAQAARQPVALVTWLSHGAQRLFSPDEARQAGELAGILADAFRRDRSGTHTTAEGEAFVQVFNPPLRMVVIGAVHATQFLLPLANMAGYQAIVVDPRTAFATPERFPAADIRAEWPEDALPAIGIDARTALVALTHDPKIDDQAILAGLRQGAFYVGALGSKRTHAQRAERLAAMGLGGEEAARIHAPIGLDIGAQGPAEIAISIIAEITAVLRGRGAVS